MNELLHSVAHLNQVAALTRRLSQNGLLETLSSALTAVFLSEQNTGKISLEDLRHCLKALTAQMVEDTGKRAESGLSSKTTSAGTTIRIEPQQFAIDYMLLESAPETRRSRERQREPPKSPHTSPRPHHQKSSSLVFIPPTAQNSFPTSPSRAESNLRSISDFAFPAPSVLFGKTVRRTLEVRDLSPGPAYYSPSVESTKEHHSSVTVPKGGKRYEYYVPDTPGPAFYTPLRAFLAKKIRKL